MYRIRIATSRRLTLFIYSWFSFIAANAFTLARNFQPHTGFHTRGKKPWRNVCHWEIRYHKRVLRDVFCYPRCKRSDVLCVRGRERILNSPVPRIPRVPVSKLPSFPKGGTKIPWNGKRKRKKYRKKNTVTIQMSLHEKEIRSFNPIRVLSPVCHKFQSFPLKTRCLDAIRPKPRSQFVPKGIANSDSDTNFPLNSDFSPTFALNQRNTSFRL